MVLACLWYKYQVMTLLLGRWMYCNSCQVIRSKLCHASSSTAWTHKKQHTKATTDIGHRSSTVDPFQLVKNDMSIFFDDIRTRLKSPYDNIHHMSQYHFDGKGKSIRPMITFLMAHTCNHHNRNDHSVLPTQRHIAMISEMIHVASLVHDDVIDASETRRGSSTVQHTWGQRKAILTGDYILSISTILLAQIRNETVVKVMSQIIADLVTGEFMQLGSKDKTDERFQHYLTKTFKKTASLMAHCCKSVAILSNSTEEVVNLAYQYGRNLGIAFQLVDDLLDYVSCQAMLGKPAAADLKLGLATAPVLFAAQEHTELNSLIMRRFAHPGDVELALGLVKQSDGVEETRLLAKQYVDEAVRCVEQLSHSQYRDSLVEITNKVLNREK